MATVRPSGPTSAAHSLEELDFDASFVLSGDQTAFATEDELLAWIKWASDDLREWKTLVIDDGRKRAALLRLLGEDRSRWLEIWQTVLDRSVQNSNLQRKDPKQLDVTAACARTVQLLVDSCGASSALGAVSSSSQTAICGHLLLDIINDLLLHAGGFFTRLLGKPNPHMHTSSNSIRHRQHPRLKKARAPSEEGEPVQDVETASRDAAARSGTSAEGGAAPAVSVAALSSDQQPNLDLDGTERDDVVASDIPEDTDQVADITAGAASHPRSAGQMPSAQDSNTVEHEGSPSADLGFPPERSSQRLRDAKTKAQAQNALQPTPSSAAIPQKQSRKRPRDRTSPEQPADGEEESDVARTKQKRARKADRGRQDAVKKPGGAKKVDSAPKPAQSIARAGATSAASGPSNMRNRAPGHSLYEVDGGYSETDSDGPEEIPAQRPQAEYGEAASSSAQELRRMEARYKSGCKDWQRALDRLRDENAAAEARAEEWRSRYKDHFEERVGRKVAEAEERAAVKLAEFEAKAASELAALREELKMARSAAATTPDAATLPDSHGLTATATSDPSAFEQLMKEQPAYKDMRTSLRVMGGELGDVAKQLDGSRREVERLRQMLGQNRIVFE